MMGPITAFFTALVGSAVLSRPKLPELEPDPKAREIAELKEKLSICEQDRDRARRMFADERAHRLQLERDLIELGARAARIDAKRAQEPYYVRPRPPLPPAPLTESITPNTSVLHAQMDQVLRDMDGWICNCAPGRHEALLGGSMLGRRIFGE